MGSFPVIQLLFKYGGTMHECDLLTAFFLGGAFLTLIRFVTGLMKIVQGRLNDQLGKLTVPSELDFPLTFAGTPSSLVSPESIEISPLPAEAYTDYKVRYHKNFGQLSRYGRVRDLVPGMWTAVMTHDTEWDGEIPSTNN